MPPKPLNNFPELGWSLESEKGKLGKERVNYTLAFKNFYIPIRIIQPIEFCQCTH